MAKEKMDWKLVLSLTLVGSLLLITQVCSGVLMARIDFTQLAYWVWTSIDLFGK